LTDPVAESLPPARSPRIRLGLWHALLLFISVLFLLPLASMIIGSLRLPGLPPPRGMEWIPKPISWANYPAVFQLIELGRYLVNTLVVEALAEPVKLLVG
jgi:multiple sugar transport system permease protein